MFKTFSKHAIQRRHQRSLTQTRITSAATRTGTHIGGNKYKVVSGNTVVIYKKIGGRKHIITAYEKDTFDRT